MVWSVCLLFIAELLSGRTAHLWHIHCTTLWLVCVSFIADQAQNFVLHGLRGITAEMHLYLKGGIADAPGDGVIGPAGQFLAQI